MSEGGSNKSGVNDDLNGRQSREEFPETNESEFWGLANDGDQGASSAATESPKVHHRS